MPWSLGDAEARLKVFAECTVTRLLRGEQVSFAGEEFHVNVGPPALVGGAEVPVLLSALGPRLLRVAGQHALQPAGPAGRQVRHPDARVGQRQVRGGQRLRRLAARQPAEQHGP